MGTFAALNTSKTEPLPKINLTCNLWTNTNAWNKGHVLNFSVKGFVDLGVGPVSLNAISEHREYISKSQHSIQFNNN